MRAALTIDSMTEAEMRRALVAWNVTRDAYEAPVLALDGLVVKAMGPSSYDIQSPAIEPQRVADLLAAAMSEEGLTGLRLLKRVRQRRAEDERDSP